MNVDQYFGVLYPAQKRDANVSYTYYHDGISFHRLEFTLHSDFKGYSLDTISLEIQAAKLWGNVPFYQELPVSDSYFFGFTGKGYYTRQCMKGSLEYLTSLYRDYLFAGPFADSVVFKGTGRGLSGWL